MVQVSEGELVDLPLLDLEVAVLGAAEHLGASGAEAVVAVVEALREVGAAVAVGLRAVGDLQVRLAEGGPEGVAAPDGLVLVEQRVALARGEAEQEGALAGVLVPLPAALAPGQRREAPDDLVGLGEEERERVGGAVALLVEAADQEVVFGGAVEQLDLREPVVEERVDGLHVVGDPAEEGRLRHVPPRLAHRPRLLLPPALLLRLVAELRAEADQLAGQPGLDRTRVGGPQLGADGGLPDVGLALALLLVAAALLPQHCQVAVQLELQAAEVLLEASDGDLALELEGRGEEAADGGLVGRLEEAVGIEGLLDRGEQVVGLEEAAERLHCLLGAGVKGDELLDLQVVGPRDYLAAFAKEEGEEGGGAGLVVVPAGVAALEADVGAGGLAVCVQAHLLRLLVVHAGHMLHMRIQLISRTLSSCAAPRCPLVALCCPAQTLACGSSLSPSAAAATAPSAAPPASGLASPPRRWRTQPESSRREASTPPRQS